VILFRKLREKAGNWLLRKHLKKQKRNIEMKKLNKLTDVGIFFDASSEQCRKTVKAFIKKLDSQKTNARSIGFFNTLKPEEDFISDKKLYFSTLKDFSFFFLPKCEELNDFVEKDLDALFVFSAEDSFPATAVIKMSKAKLKVGFSHLFDDALDLTFEIPSHQPEQLTEQIERYL
jgi:hypothetical protein